MSRVCFDPAFALQETVTRFRQHLERGLPHGTLARAMAGERVAECASSPDFVAQLEARVLAKLEETLARWRSRELHPAHCLAEVAEMCPRSFWPMVHVSLDSSSPERFAETATGLGYAVAPLSHSPGADPVAFFRPFGIVPLQVPPVMELLGPLADIEGVAGLFDAERRVCLPPIPPPSFAARLHNALPRIDPDGVRERIGLGRCGEGVRVCVCDTGIDASHPDLEDAVVDAADFTGEGTLEDRFGHGTHVAGIVAGRGRASGGQFAGVAPGAMLLSARVLDSSGRGFSGSVIEGLVWAYHRGAHITNLSLGSPGVTDGMSEETRNCNALAERGVLPVIAAGNEGPGPGTIAVPGDARDALTVGALSLAGDVCRFSSRGPTAMPGNTGVKPDLLAPGEMVVSCLSRSSSDPAVSGFPEYTAKSGTSMATPVVAGIAAVLVGEAMRDSRQLLPAELKRVLRDTCVSLPNAFPEAQGRGVVSLSAAFTRMFAQAGNAGTAATQAPIEAPTEGEIPMPDEILSVDELADYLKLKPVTLYKLLRQGKVPGFKVGGTWRFRKSTIDDWIAQSEQPVTMDGGAAEPAPAPFSVKCGVCGLKLAKEPANSCEAGDCGVPICDRCWGVHNRHVCKDHRGAKHPVSAKAPIECVYCGNTADEISMPGCDLVNCSIPVCAFCHDNGKPKCPKHMYAGSGAHAGDPQPIRHPDGPLFCSYCFENKYEHEIGGHCEYDYCDRPICSVCWDDQGHNMCSPHTLARIFPSRTEPAAVRPASLEDLLHTGMAQLAAIESGFFERVRAQLAGTRELYDPATGEAIPFAKAWKLVSEASSEDKVRKVLKKYPKALAGLAHPPGNREQAYSIKGFGDSLFALLVRCLSRVIRGFVDAGIEFVEGLPGVLDECGAGGPVETMLAMRPWNATDLANLLTAEAAAARKGKRQAVLALYSPDGWTSDAIALVSPAPGRGGAAGRFASPDLSVILLGPGPADCHFHAGDARAALLAPLFAPELPVERIDRCRLAIDNLMVGEKYLSLDALVAKLDQPRGLVRSAMEQAAKVGKDYAVETIKDVGVIIRRRG